MHLLSLLFSALTLVPAPMIFAVGNPFFPEATLTEDIYWANKPPAVRALRGMSPDQVSLVAKQLADAGYTIDVPIMVYNWGAVTTMGIRKVEGFTWVPSGNQPNIPVMPGLVVPGLPVYDALHPPAGSIKVSLDAADYPSFDPPPPPPPPAATNIVGAREWGNVFTYGPGAWSASIPKHFVVNGKTGADIDGQTVMQDGVIYTAHYVVGLVGETLNFTR